MHSNMRGHQGPAESGAFPLHLPVNQPAFLQLVRRLERLRAAARELLLALLLVRRRGAALGFALVDFLLHRRRRGRGGDCILAESVPSRQRRGEQQGESADCGGELHGNSFFCRARAARVLPPWREDSAQSFTLPDTSGIALPTNCTSD